MLVLNSETIPYKPDLQREQTDHIHCVVGSAAFDGFSEFVISSAEPWYDEINEEFTRAVAEAEQRGFRAEYSKKGKRVFIGHQNGEIRAVAIAH